MRLSLSLLLIVGLAKGAMAAETRVTHGMSLFGELKYPPDFTHLEYVNPNAPKGGDVRMEATGSFDSLNSHIIKGSPAAGLGLIYQQLLVGAQDEASSEYGLIAENVEVPDDLSWVAFNLREEAKWHDGKPITSSARISIDFRR